MIEQWRWWQVSVLVILAVLLFGLGVTLHSIVLNNAADNTYFYCVQMCDVRHDAGDTLANIQQCRETCETQRATW